MVGEEYKNATPVFADSMTFVVFRPYWNAPHRTPVWDILPRIRKKRPTWPATILKSSMPSTIQRVLNPRRINWSRVDLTKVGMRQRGGSPTNPLGLIKFMFPNQYAIYLHDTPSRRSFGQPQRTLSHGCVWVEKPVDLADYVLAGQGDWNEKKIRQAMLTAHSARRGGKGRRPQRHP